MVVSMNKEWSASSLIRQQPTFCNLRGGKNCLLQGWRNEAIYSLGIMTVCRGGLFTMWIEWAPREEPVSPGCPALCCPQGSWAPSNNSNQLLHGHPTRPITVLMEFYLMMWKWHVIFFYGFHNSQAIWPNDHRAQQELLPHSLTKLGVRWVCAGCNELAMYRAHLGHVASPRRSRNTRTSFGKRKFKNRNSKIRIYPFADAKSRYLFLFFFFFHIFAFCFVKQLRSHRDMRQIRQDWMTVVFPPLTHNSGGNKIPFGPCTTYGAPQCASPISTATAAGRALGCSSRGVRAPK